MELSSKEFLLSAQSAFEHIVGFGRFHEISTIKDLETILVMLIERIANSIFFQ